MSKNEKVTNQITKPSLANDDKLFQGEVVVAFWAKLNQVTNTGCQWATIKKSQNQITKKYLANHDNLCQGEVVVALWGSTTEGDGSRLPAFRFEMLWL